jgi:hypothetical protein
MSKTEKTHLQISIKSNINNQNEKNPYPRNTIQAPKSILNQNNRRKIPTFEFLHTYIYNFNFWVGGSKPSPTPPIARADTAPKLRSCHGVAGDQKENKKKGKRIW